MIVGVYSMISAIDTSLNYGMYINILICIAGVLSITYHFKTLKFYKNKTQKILLEDTSLWVSNLIYALLLIYMSLKLTYTFYNFDVEGAIDTGLYVMYAFCFFIFLLGVCLIFEERLLYKRIIQAKNQSNKDNIDDIKGVDKN